MRFQRIEFSWRAAFVGLYLTPERDKLWITIVPFLPLYFKKIEGAEIMQEAESGQLSPIEQQFTSKILMAMAGCTSREISNFSSWMIAGAAAFYAVVISSLDKLTPHLNAGELGMSIKIFLIAATLNVFQRLVGSIVLSAATASHELESLHAPPGIDILGVLKIMETTTWWPARLLVRRSFNKLKNGDLLVSGRQNVHLAQLQAWLVFIQIGLICFSGWRLLP